MLFSGSKDCNPTEGAEASAGPLGAAGHCRTFGRLAHRPPKAARKVRQGSAWPKRSVGPQDGVVKVWDGELQCQDVLQALQNL